MLRDRTDTRDTLWRIASKQRGFFTAAQALDVGYSYQSHRFHAQRGNWLRVDRGIYRFREFGHMPSEGDEHLVRWSLWSRGRAVASHTTSLAAHGLGIANADEIHLTIPPGFRQRDSAVVLHKADLRPEEIEQRAGYRLTTPVRAVVDCAAAGLEQSVIASAIAHLMQHGQATQQELLHVAEQLGPRAELGVERALRAEH
ncbi:hypothetical protein [Kitasatospora sp. NPDC088351]|uniref:type IV toxin-antitoxin system AbiEi family antitoxin domain-containing protein n=1 Tax=Kitasatospora sp. NPDC088351 TaxID=3155180 RepID=UPI00342F61E0